MILRIPILIAIFSDPPLCRIKYGIRFSTAYPFQILANLKAGIIRALAQFQDPADNSLGIGRKLTRKPLIILEKEQPLSDIWAFLVKCPLAVAFSGLDHSALGHVPEYGNLQSGKPGILDCFRLRRFQGFA